MNKEEVQLADEQVVANVGIPIETIEGESHVGDDCLHIVCLLQ